MEPKYPTFIHQRNALSRAGKNPHVIRRMPSGWAVMGDDQFLPGYSLLVADPEVDHLTDLDDERRVRFLLDMSLLGEAVFAATPAHRINYEILGNSVPALHATCGPGTPTSRNNSASVRCAGIRGFIVRARRSRWTRTVDCSH